MAVDVKKETPHRALARAVDAELRKAVDASRNAGAPMSDEEIAAERAVIRKRLASAHGLNRGAQ